MWMLSSIPIAVKLTRIDDPPYDRNGNGMPVIGMIPITIPTLTNIWIANIDAMPAATERAEQILR